MGAPSTTDIYTVKLPKPEEAQKGYFSFLRSFISMERDGVCTDREGIIIAMMDGLTDYEIMDLLIASRKMNDHGVRDVRSFGGIVKILCLANYMQCLIW